MKIVVEYDRAAWPAGGYIAYDDDTTALQVYG